METDVKEAVPKYNSITPAQYLEMERASEYKNEYYDGYVQAMSGASLKHNIIASNIAAKVDHFLNGKNCRMLQSDMRVCTPSSDSYMYPDALIICGKPEIEDDKFDTLKNPSVIFEIISSSTALYDKGRKFFFYQQIPSLLEYIMIDSKKNLFSLVANKLMDHGGLNKSLIPTKYSILRRSILIYRFRKSISVQKFNHARPMSLLQFFRGHDLQALLTLFLQMKTSIHGKGNPRFAPHYSTQQNISYVCTLDW